MSYEALVATALYLPALTGAAGPSPLIPSREFDGAPSILAAPSMVTMALPVPWWGAVWLSPYTLVDTACVYETGGSTHGLSIWRDSDSAAVVSTRSDVSAVVATSGGLAGDQWSHVAWRSRNADVAIRINGGAWSSVSAPTGPANGGDPGGIGGPQSSGVGVVAARDTAGGQVLHGERPFLGRLADLCVFAGDPTDEQVSTLYAGPQAAASPSVRSPVRYPIRY